MKRLYTPFKVNKLELKNRVIMSPMSIGHTVDGFIMDDVVEFYKRRAQGGVGLIIFANMQWDKLRYNPNHGAMLTDEKYIPSLKKLTDAIHEGGSKVFAQLMHRGRCANRASIQGEQAVAPSPIPGRFTHFEMPKELTVEEIKEFVDWQAEAAVIAKTAGFDGIEIETNYGYLYGQFFSPLTNHRTDEYGGSLENRCRFMVETLEGMRAAVGPDYPISLRVSGSDFMDGGCNGDDIAEICELLDKTGYVDGFSITAGWHESAVPLITMEVPHGAWAYLGRQIKARVKAPVAQGMRMNIEKAEELVDRGDFDAIVEDFEVVRSEMRKYDPELDERPFFVAGNKLDEVPEEFVPELTAQLADYFEKKGVSFMTLSALTEEGIPELVKRVTKFTADHPRPESSVRLYALEEKPLEKMPNRKRMKIQIISMLGGGYRVLHYKLEKAVERYDFSQEENVARFTKRLRRYKVEELLEAAGAQPGDLVSIGYKDFNFYPDYYPEETYDEEPEPELEEFEDGGEEDEDE